MALPAEDDAGALRAMRRRARLRALVPWLLAAALAAGFFLWPRPMSAFIGAQPAGASLFLIQPDGATQSAHLDADSAALADVYAILNQCSWHWNLMTPFSRLMTPDGAGTVTDPAACGDVFALTGGGSDGGPALVLGADTTDFYVDGVRCTLCPPRGTTSSDLVRQPAEAAFPESRAGPG